MGLSLDREPIVAALAARLKARCPSLKDVTRLYRPYNRVEAEEKPLAIVVVGSQRGDVRRGAPSTWTLQLPVYLYTHADEASLSTVPSTQLNALVKEIEDALERDTAAETPSLMDELYSTNLGLKNVYVCRLTSVETDEGLLQPEGVAVLTVEVTAIPG